MAERADEVDVNLATVMKNLVGHSKSTKARHESRTGGEGEMAVTDTHSSHAEEVKQPSAVRKWYARNCEHQELFEYNMRHRKRGKALIINNKNFTYSGGKNRDGTDFDRDSLIKTLGNLGFRMEDITVKDDAKVSEMKSLMTYLAQHDYTGSDCSFAAVLSHGDTDVVDGKDGSVKIDELLEPFKRAPTLAGKPKIFLFQCCRGANYDSGTAGYDHDGPRTERRISRESDFLTAYSTTPGYYSWRSVYTGSWFIQSFCDVLDFSGKTLEFQQSLSRVCHLVSNYHESYTDDIETSGKKQSPLICSTLTKELYFS